jgi:hypothetical protein
LGKGKRQKARGRVEPKKDLKSRLVGLLPPDWDILAVILFLAIALRLWFALSYTETLYDQVGEGVRLLNAVRGEPVDATLPPLYVGFLRILLSMFRYDAAKVAFIIKAVLGTCSVALIYYIAKSISSRTVAVVSAALTALYLNYMMAGLALSPRVPGVFVLLMVKLMIIRGADSKKHSVISGAVLGLGILIDPYLLLFTPGFILVVRQKRMFLVGLIVAVLPWSIRNSIQERMPLLVYRHEAVELDLSRWKIVDFRSFFLLIDKIYVNASQLISRGGSWVEAGGSETSESIRNSSTFGAYIYVFTAIAGVVGLLRCRRSEQRVFLMPALIYLGILVLFSTVRSTNRLLGEHLAIYYASALIIMISGRFRRKGETS